MFKVTIKRQNHIKKLQNLSRINYEFMSINSGFNSNVNSKNELSGKDIKRDYELKLLEKITNNKLEHSSY